MHASLQFVIVTRRLRSDISNNITNISQLPCFIVTIFREFRMHILSDPNELESLLLPEPANELAQFSSDKTGQYRPIIGVEMK